MSCEQLHLVFFTFLVHVCVHVFILPNQVYYVLMGFIYKKNFVLKVSKESPKRILN